MRVIKRVNLFFLSLVILANVILYLVYSQASASVLDDLFGAFTKNTERNIEGFKVYDNASQKIKILYPSNWRFNNTLDQEDPGLLVTFSSPINESIEILKDNLGSTTKTLKQDANDVITFYRNSSEDFKLLELRTDVTLSGHPAYKIVYTEIDPDSKTIFKTMEVTSIIGNNAYTILYTANQNKYSALLVQKMVDSFQTAAVSDLVR